MTGTDGRQGSAASLRVPRRTSRAGLHHRTARLECVFEEWSDRRTLRLYDPPRPVWIDMAAAGVAGVFTPANTVPLRVRTGGARLEHRMQGWQHAWLQSSDGRWLGVVSVRVSSANELSHAAIPLTVAAVAIHPAEHDTKDEP